MPLHRTSLLITTMIMTTALVGCLSGGGNDAQVTVVGTSPRVEQGSARMLTIADGTLDAGLLNHRTFDPKAVLDEGSVSFRRIDGGRIDFGDGSGEQLIGTFYLGYFELTQGQWRSLTHSLGVTDITKTHPWRSLSPADLAGAVEADQRPAIGISEVLLQQVLTTWNAARGGGQPTLRLPTVIEWEFAARAGPPGRYTWGDAEDLEHITSHAVVRETRVARGADVVGGRGATTRSGNALGMFDLHGNVWEFVDAPGTDATLLGGSWSDNLTSSRLGVGMHLDRQTSHALCGVRLVLVVP